VISLAYRDHRGIKAGFRLNSIISIRSRTHIKFSLSIEIESAERVYTTPLPIEIIEMAE
jgi:hypothetical protein